MHLTSIVLALACSKPVPPTPAPAAPVEDPSSQSADALAAFFAEQWDANLAADPIMRTYLGVGSDHSDWGDLSDAGHLAKIDRSEAALNRLRSEFDPSQLPAESALSYRLFEANAETLISERPWAQHDYIFEPLSGRQSWLASFMMGVQPLSKPEHVDDWLSRLAGVDDQLDIAINMAKVRETNGVLPPSFAFDATIDSMENLVTGAPFGGKEDSPMLATFRQKIASIELSDADRETHIQAASTLLKDEVGPAYRRSIELMKEQSARATTDDGAWKLPSGNDYYRHRLTLITTTDLDPDTIHATGLAEVERIHGEMREIQAQLGVKGDLADFFVHVQNKPELTLPDTPQGRDQYLALAQAYVDGMNLRLGEVFSSRPNATLEVKAVESWREQSAGKAFYQRGTVDGTRPGVFYANLSDMSQVPTYQLQALVYHEGIPGHHMQLSIAQELTTIPAFRRHMQVTSWSEGWGLYSEWLPKEMGLYEDPYSDFGRLAMELWRAGRLVVDTGIHHKKWSRQQSIDWLVANTPNSETDATKATERYILWPGQATAYKIGMLELQRLRTDAETRLGDRFDLREFHEVVLRSGPLPLDVLGEQVDRWVTETQ